MGAASESLGPLAPSPSPNLSGSTGCSPAQGQRLVGSGLLWCWGQGSLLPLSTSGWERRGVQSSWRLLGFSACGRESNPTPGPWSSSAFSNLWLLGVFHGKKSYPRHPCWDHGNPQQLQLAGGGVQSGVPRETWRLWNPAWPLLHFCCWSCCFPSMVVWRPNGGSMGPGCIRGAQPSPRQGRQKMRGSHSLGRKLPELLPHAEGCRPTPFSDPGRTVPSGGSGLPSARNGAESPGQGQLKAGVPQAVGWEAGVAIWRNKQGG